MSAPQLVGGELVSGLVPTQPPQPEPADYLFREHGVIAELKALEVDSFGEAYSRKLGELTHDWMRRGLMLVYGRARIEMHRLHPICQNEWMEVLTEPLQKKVVAKANRQLRQTAELLNMPSAKGVLWVASDGNLDPGVPQVPLLESLDPLAIAGDPKGCDCFLQCHPLECAVLSEFSTSRPVSYTTQTDTTLVRKFAANLISGGHSERNL